MKVTSSPGYHLLLEVYINAEHITIRVQDRFHKPQTRLQRPLILFRGRSLQSTKHRLIDTSLTI